MNTRERFLAVMEFEPCDRTLLWEWGYWGGTVNRWYEEGLPRRKGLRDHIEFGGTLAGPGAAWRSGVLNVEDAEDVADFCEFDGGRETVPLQNFIFPTYDEEVLEDQGDNLIVRTAFGTVIQKRKDDASVPQPLSWPVQTRYDWEQVKAELAQRRVSSVPD